MEDLIVIIVLLIIFWFPLLFILPVWSPDSSQWTSPNDSTDSSGALWQTSWPSERFWGEEHSIFLLEGNGVFRDVVGAGLMGFLFDLWLFSIRCIFSLSSPSFYFLFPFCFKIVYCFNIDYYSSRSTQLICQHNVLCMLKAVKRNRGLPPLQMTRMILLFWSFLISVILSMPWQQNVLCMWKADFKERESSVSIGVLGLANFLPFADFRRFRPWRKRQ